MKLNELILKSGLKKEHIAKLIGVTNVTLSKWIAGETSPDFKYVLMLKEILNLDSLDELVDDKSGDRV